MMRSRRRALAGIAAWLLPRTGFTAQPPSASYAPVLRGRPLRFPADHGAHPAFRTEWWYITGRLATAAHASLGFQITFFRNRSAAADANPSAFAPRQILIGHAALSDPVQRHTLFDQRVARQGFGLAGAEAGAMRIWIDEWSLRAQDDGLRAVIAAREFSFDLALKTRTPPLLNGEDGFSRKGRREDAASYYYSLPHLEVAGRLSRDRRHHNVTGLAWLDHEWSSSYLEPESLGWDWIGINAADGGAVMAFRMRGRDGSMRWAGATYRTANGATRAFAPHEVSFTPQRTWRSSRTGAAYPVSLQVSVGDLKLEIEPLFDDQEIDARVTTGTVYWEGAVRVSRSGNAFGEGYLELTGYWRPLKM